MSRNVLVICPSSLRDYRHFGGSILPATLCLRLLVEALGSNMLPSPTALNAERLAILALDRNDSPPPLREAEVLIESLGPDLLIIDVSPAPIPIRKGLTEARLAPPASAELGLLRPGLEEGEGASVPEDEGEPESNLRSYGAGAMLRRLVLREDCGPIPDSRRESLAVSVMDITELSPMDAVRADDDAVGLSRRESDEVDAEGKMGLCRLSAKGDSFGLWLGKPVLPRRDTLPDIGDSEEVPSSETVLRLDMGWAVRCRNAFQSLR